MQRPTPEHITPERFRQVLGQYPTGVAVVAATDHEGAPLGMTVGSFSSVSLEPPLVSFMPDHRSVTWQRIREAGRFCVNVLGEHQEHVCRALAMKDRAARFAGLEWTPSPGGSPMLTDAVAYIDCEIDAVHRAGDHDIVVGRVLCLGSLTDRSPLLFFRGGYGAFAPLSRATADAGLAGQLRQVDLVRHHMDALAAALSTECTAIALVGEEELVLMAAAGRTRASEFLTRVGQRMPFAPPLGGVFAAWGSQERVDRWVRRLHAHATPGERARAREALSRIRERGYALAMGHATTGEIERLSDEISRGVADRTALADPLRDALELFNPDHLDPAGRHELRWVSAPVRDADGQVVLTLTAWGPPEALSAAEIEQYADTLVAAASAASASLAGSP